MGGIPVMRRSTISSCYDDSDNTLTLVSNSTNSNQVTTLTRGSLPVVIVDRWEDVTKERLENEWLRITRTPPESWDWKRLFINHWIDRIKMTNSSRSV